MILPVKRIIPLLSLSVSALGAQLPSPPPDSTQTHQVHALLAQATDLALNHFDTRGALALYSEALSMAGKNSEILWRISRSYIDIADELPAGTDVEISRQLEMYEQALEFAEKSVAVGPQNSMAFTLRGIARARVTRFKGFWESVGLLDEVREDLERALEIDSTNHRAHYALARVHEKVVERPWIIRWPLGLGWGSRETALEHFETAARLGWDDIEYRLACAHVYIDEEDYERARAHLSLIPLLKPQRRSDEASRREARHLLDRLSAEQ